MLAWWLAEQGAEAAGAAAGAHGAAAEAEGIPELPNLLGVIHHILGEKAPLVADTLDNFAKSIGLNDPMGSPFTALENIIFALVVIGGLSWFFISGYLRLRKSPKDGRLSRRAMFSEIIVMFFDDFFCQILGKKEGRKHLPFVGTLFVYIFCCNSLGLIFLGKAPTANLSFNLGMSILVVFYVHFTGISRNALGYLKHYPGSCRR